jgi:Domain of unknown function (DUF4136)
MKKVLLLSGLLIFVVLQQSCTASKKTAVVGKNADVTADFKDIKTYDWSADIDNIPKDAIFVGPNGVYVFNNESTRKMIKDAMLYELDSRGYTRSTTNPDMLISFSVLEQPARLRTTNGYLTLPSGQNVQTGDNVTQTDVKPGTLIINFTNAKTGKMIWQGFASGILQADQTNDQAKVRQAVSSVFNQFKYNNKV